MQNSKEPTDQSVTGPFQAIEGVPVDIGYGIEIDFPVDPKRALRPNGTSMDPSNRLTRVALGGADSYNTNPQYLSWTGDRTTFFTYTVERAGHAAGNAVIAGSQTPAAQVRVTANTPSLGTTTDTLVTLNPNNNHDITFEDMTVRFPRRTGSTSTQSFVGGDYGGNFRANDSVYVGSERRFYTIEVREAGKLTNSSALDAQITVTDQAGNTLQSYGITDLRSQHEFELGQGTHFEGAMADFTASTSTVSTPTPVGSAPNIVSRVNNNYSGATNETAIIEITQAGRPDTARYRYFYNSAPSVDLEFDEPFNVGSLNLPDNVRLNIADTPPPEFSSFNPGGLTITRDASGYIAQQDATFTTLVQTTGGTQTLQVDWEFADSSTASSSVILTPGHAGTELDIGLGVKVVLAVDAVDGDSFSGSIEAHELNIGERWSVDLSAGRVEVGDRFRVSANPRTLDVGTQWNITGEVPMWEVNDTYVVDAQHNFHAPLNTLGNSVTLTDPNTGAPLMGEIQFNGTGSFNTGDEIRIHTRGFTGNVSSSGLYTDNLYPTDYIVTITQPGGVGVAQYDWVREDGRTETQFGGSGSGTVTAFNTPILLEEGVFVSFAHNGSGDTYLATGDQFVIPVGQKLEYTFAGDITLQSDDNIELTHKDAEAVNTFGRLLYEGDTPNEAGTEGNTLSGILGTNIEVSVDDINLLGAVNAEVAIDTIDESLDQVIEARVQVGASINRIQYRIASELNSAEQIAESRQRIREADIAVEVSELTRSVTRQNAIPMLAQIAQLNLERSLSLLTSLNG